MKHLITSALSLLVLSSSAQASVQIGNDAWVCFVDGHESIDTITIPFEVLQKSGKTQITFAISNPVNSHPTFERVPATYKNFSTRTRVGQLEETTYKFDGGNIFLSARYNFLIANIPVPTQQKEILTIDGEKYDLECSLFH